MSRQDVNGFATGALQVFHGGAFGAICSASFDTAAAGVACRQLGFIDGIEAPLAIFSGLLGPEFDQLREVPLHATGVPAVLCGQYVCDRGDTLIPQQDGRQRGFAV